MKFRSILVTPLVPLAAAYGRPVKFSPWTIRDLHAFAIPHSIQSNFSLSLTTTRTVASCFGSGTTYQDLGSLARTNCTPNSISFSWTRIGEAEGMGAELKLFDSETHQQATRQIPTEEIVWENMQPNPKGRVQVYEGPRTFIVVPISN